VDADDLMAAIIGIGMLGFQYVRPPAILSIAIGPRGFEDFRLVAALAR
jgi:hypothetical protein